MINCYVVLVCFLSYAAAWVLARRRRPRCHKSGKNRALIALGFGGHLREMYEIVKNLDPEKYEFKFISDEEDHLTMVAFRERLLDLAIPKKERKQTGISAPPKDLFYTVTVPKTGRYSKFTLLTTIVKSLLQCLLHIHRIKPDIIITNGPGIAVPLCYAALLFKFTPRKSVKVAYIESCCRVENLSYSGRLVYHIADRFIVLWPQLAAKYPGAIYLGHIDRL